MDKWGLTQTRLTHKRVKVWIESWGAHKVAEADEHHPSRTPKTMLSVFWDLLKEPTILALISKWAPMQKSDNAHQGKLIAHRNLS